MSMLKNEESKERPCECYKPQKDLMPPAGTVVSLVNHLPNCNPAPTNLHVHIRTNRLSAGKCMASNAAAGQLAFYTDVMALY